MDPKADGNLVLYQTFPRVTKCSFATYGRGGRETVQDYLCVLAPNIISEKVFTFLWFWYLILAAITAVNLFLIISMAVKSSRVRKFYLTKVAWTRKVIWIISSPFYIQAVLVIYKQSSLHFNRILAYMRIKISLLSL